MLPNASTHGWYRQTPTTSNDKLRLAMWNPLAKHLPNKLLLLLSLSFTFLYLIIFFYFILTQQLDSYIILIPVPHRNNGCQPLPCGANWTGSCMSVSWSNGDEPHTPLSSMNLPCELTYGRADGSSSRINHANDPNIYSFLTNESNML